MATLVLLDDTLYPDDEPGPEEHEVKVEMHEELTIEEPQPQVEESFRTTRSKKSILSGTLSAESANSELSDEEKLFTEERPNFKCMICLEPCDNNRLSESADIVSSFVVVAVKSSSKHFATLPKKSFTEGLSEAWYCNTCYNRLHQLNYLHKKITSLKEKLNSLTDELERDILTTYYREGDSPDENESKKVTKLRRRFYKISVKAVPINTHELDPLEELKTVSNAIIPDNDIEPSSPGLFITGDVHESDHDEDKQDVLWTPAEEGRRTRSGRSIAPQPLVTRKSIKKSIAKIKLKTKEKKAIPAKKDVPKVSKGQKSKKEKSTKAKPKPITRTSRKRKLMENENQEASDEAKAEPSEEESVKKNKIKRLKGPCKLQIYIYDFPCTVEGCELAFASEAHRFVHIKKVHEGVIKPYTCKECGKSFHGLAKLNVHLRIHSGETPFICEFCGKTFKASWYLKQHVRIHNGNFICTVCGKRCVSRFNLEAHMNSHSNLKPFVCEVCGDAYATKQYLLFHQANKHEGITSREPVECSECHKRFSSVTSLRNHLVSAHKIGTPKYRCEVCNSAWNNKRELRIHYSVVHLNERHFECDVCHKKLSSAGNLRVHKERQHWPKEDRPRPFKCSVCAKAFFIKKTLQNHMALHSGTRPFSCDQCNKSFPSKSYLNLHVYTIHDKRQRKTPVPEGQEKPKKIKPKRKYNPERRLQIQKLPIIPPPPVTKHEDEEQQEENLHILPNTVELLTFANHEDPNSSVQGQYYYTCQFMPDSTLAIQIIN